MADCKDIDAALARLSGKIDGLSSRLNGLEAKQKECCDNKQQNKDIDLSALIKRINDLEKYIDSLETGFSQAIEIIKKITNIIKGLFK